MKKKILIGAGIYLAIAVVRAFIYKQSWPNTSVISQTLTYAFNPFQANS